LKQPIVRALLTSAAVAAAIALAGCNPESVIPSGRAQAPLSDKMLADMEAKQMDKESPILVRIFKEESEMEVWKKNRGGEYALLKTYPICRWSGDLGPKKKEGDRQAPEGFYTITPGQMNPNSSYYLAFNTGYPNSYDRAWGYTGSELMVHGDCSSRGCYAMTDEQIQEIYALARESFFGGQKDFQLQAFPFRMTALNMAKHRNNPNFAFWKMIKEGYDHFEATHQEPKVAVCEKRYVFDAAAPENASKPLKFDARGKCPVYQLDPQIAEAVTEKMHSEQTQMAQYISRDVTTVPPRNGLDGGMNPVFLAKLQHDTGYDNNGRTYTLAGASAPGYIPRVPPTQAPGYMPRTPNAPAAKPTAVATTRVPAAAPQPTEPAPQPEQRAVASLFGGLFGGSNAEAKPAKTASETLTPPTLRGSNTDLAAKPKRATPTPLAVANAAPQPKAQEAAKLKTVANATPPAQPQQASASAPEVRTAFSAPQPTDGLLAGAQPVVPTGSFESRWSAFR
jgi:murein L,D-transpeptidase YafK